MPDVNPSEIERLQNQILRIGEQSAHPFSAATQAAFRALPRHSFVRYYRSGESVVTVTPENLSQHLAAIYHNGPLSFWEDKARGIFSTISQPTFVLWMLDLLKLSEGQRVFELGAGSGWNAALMGHIVGPTGRVISVEIIPEMAKYARDAIASCGIRNVEVVAGDGGDGFAEAAPYDRAVFTAGSYDLPRCFHDQIRVDGILLMVVKVAGGGDQLMVLHKKADCFESTHSISCMFVPMTGDHAYAGSRPKCLEELPGWHELKLREIERRGFWWGGNVEAAMWGYFGIRSFLTIAEPGFCVFYDKHENEADQKHWFCGVFDPDAGSLAIARKGELVSYGNFTARDRLLARLHEWIDLGMPTLAAMNLKVYPAGVVVREAPHQWVVKRTESTFAWTLGEAAVEQV